LRPYRYTNIALVILLVALDIAFLGGWILWGWLLVLLLAYVALLAFGAFFIQWNFYLTSLNRGAKTKLIALSFDDGPAGETQAILDILREHQIEAAFFVIGKNAKQHPDILKNIDAAGHIIGNHSFNHGFGFDWLPASKMAKEIDRTNELVNTTIGKTPDLFRPPYGVTNPNLARAVKRTGMLSIGWSLRSFDTMAKDPKALLELMLAKLEGGDIILFHDSMAVTREILTDFIRGAKQKGFTFTRLDKLLEIDAYV
jgi:peptidoglycan/xylan/chitin deacetylase (PgdA/CDA1 family)